MSYSHSSICFCVFLTLAFLTVPGDGGFWDFDWLPIPEDWRMKLYLLGRLLFDKQKCSNENECSGPIAHYTSLNCTPVKEDGDCCAWRYDCDHLYKRIQNGTSKCYLNGHEYDIGERIKREDANLCESDCICTNTTGGGFVDFQCTSREQLCDLYISKRCYWRNSVHRCCPKEKVCPIFRNRRKMKSVCHLNGDTFLDGEYVVPKNKPDHICVCRANYTDENLECVLSNRWFWSDIHATTAFYKECIPVYFPLRNNILGIHRETWRCPNVGDEIIRAEYFKDDRDVCIFGNNLIMHIGDKLNNILYGNDFCIVCSCDVSPVPSCVLRDKTFC